MHDFIAAVMTVLGTLLVLGGAVVIVVRATLPGTTPAEEVPPSLEIAPASHPSAYPSSHAADPRRPGRLLGTVSRVQPSDRLIAWGVALLVIAAAVAGMISVNVGITTTGR